MNTYIITLSQNDKGLWFANTTLDGELLVSYHAETPDEVLELLAARFRRERKRAAHIQHLLEGHGA